MTRPRTAGPRSPASVPGAGTPVEVASNAGGAVATSDGKTIVFMKCGADASIWKVDADGRQPVELVSGGLVPVISRDDRHVIYFSAGSGVQSGDAPSLRMVPIEGGQPTEIVRRTPLPEASMSHRPEGRLMFVSSETQNQFAFVVCDLPMPARTAGSGLTPELRNAPTRWMPDGRSIAYVDTSGSNIWSQPLDGGPPRQITHFTDRMIASFAWSHDGKRLAIVRTTTTNDIVLFKGLRK